MDKFDFERDVLQADGPILADFWAPWCGYCRRLAPVVDRLEKEVEGQVKVVRVNIDECPEVAERYHVEMIPSLILFQNGEASEQLLNSPSQAVMRDWLKEKGVLKG